MRFVRLWILLLAFAAGAFASLEEKLPLHWRQYEAATASAIRNWEKDASLPQRAQWEHILSEAPPLTAGERMALHTRQSRLALAAKARDIGSSRLDLDELRRLPEAQSRRFCAEFPKGGMLHVHPAGTVDEKTLVRLLERANPVLHPAHFASELAAPGAGGELLPADLAFLKRLGAHYGEEVRYRTLAPQDQKRFRDLFFYPGGHPPFSRFQASFTLLFGLLFTDPKLDPAPIMYDALFARARREKVDYLELSERLTPTAPGGQSWEVWAEDVQRRYGVTVGMLASYARYDRPATLEKAAQSLLSSPPPLPWIGVNIVADETNRPALEATSGLYVPLLAVARAGRTKLHRTAHAGELGDPRDVRDALLLGAERIGHGVLLVRDPLTLEYARLHHVPLEANLTSNVKLGGVPSLTEHPFLFFLRLGLRVSLSTDDEGMFRTDINEECVKAVRGTDVNYAELRAMAWNSLDTSFAEPSVKARLETRWLGEVRHFEKTWAARLTRPARPRVR